MTQVLNDRPAWIVGEQVQESLEQVGKIRAAAPRLFDPSLAALHEQVTRKELEVELAAAQTSLAERRNGAGARPA